ncbi:MAG: aldehyde dehydrogenase family protein, partial [Chloroflexi bacterium]|nr:aldehyde dehydrogenase family protein [Chloroflexota bacterium]MCI0854430.1 aldehyde dehydrogenase family protein [Chloroflexota bacterium]
MEEIRNFIDGVWQTSSAEEHLDVTNPATGETLGRVPLSTPGEVDQAAQAAAEAFSEWRRTPAVERVQYLFKLKVLLDENLEQLSRTITLENGKTLGESRGEMRRAIENVEVACGI